MKNLNVEKLKKQNLSLFQELEDQLDDEDISHKDFLGFVEENWTEIKSTLLTAVTPEQLLIEWYAERKQG
jgi:hypothetical protein